MKLKSIRRHKEILSLALGILFLAFSIVVYLVSGQSPIAQLEELTGQGWGEENIAGENDEGIVNTVNTENDENAEDGEDVVNAKDAKDAENTGDVKDAENTQSIGEVREGELYHVAGIVDGDTLKIWVGRETQTVRLLGIDTPESKHPSKPVECFAEEAALYLDELVNGKEIYLEVDPTQGDRDYYGRLLRYVRDQGGRDINAQMIEDGYAYSYKKYPHFRLEEYNRLEQEAREGARGLWAESTCGGER